MNEKDKFLTIGQFAAMHGINKKTLMWYDEIGLFQPAAVNPANGYRCYSYHQSPVLETILLLRELDVSVSEIQDFMGERSAAGFKRLLEEKTKELDRSIVHLQAVRKMVCNYRHNMETLLSMDLSEICVVEKDERCLITVEIDSNTSFEEKVEMITAKTEEYQLGRLHDASYGSMIAVDSLKNYFEEASAGFRRNGILFLVRKHTYPKPYYDLCCDWSFLRYADNYSYGKSFDKQSEPNRIGVFTKRKIDDWVEYLTQGFRNLERIDAENKRKITGYRNRLEALPDVVWNNDKNCGHITRHGLTYTFDIRQTDYSEKISLDYRCRTLDDFLALSDNKLILNPDRLQL